jgi:hypothetical protein
VALVALIGLTVTLAEVVTYSRERAAQRAQVATAGLLIDAQTISVSLSAADSAAAAEFLHLSADRAAFETAFRNDLWQAESSLAHAALTAGGAVDVAADVRGLSTWIPDYSALVATALANDRAQNVVGGAYLGEANVVMTQQLLPRAQGLYESAGQQVAANYRSATRPWPYVVAVAVFALCLVTLLLVQWRMSVTFRRTLNLALVAATLLIFGAVLWFGFALGGQNDQIATARHDDVGPIAALTRARILAQRLRADDELTLVTRDEVPSFQADFSRERSQLVSDLASGRHLGSVYLQLERAGSELTDISRVHQLVRAADATGDLQLANVLVAAPGPGHLPTLYGSFDDELGRAVATDQSGFVATTGAAQDDLDYIHLGLVALGVLSILLVLVGVQPRIEEYR